MKSNNDSIDMKGRLTLRLSDLDGNLVREIAADNDIVLTGRDLVAKLFADVAGTKPISHIAVGTGTEPVDPLKDEKLGNEIARKPIAAIDTAKHITDMDGKKRVVVSTELLTTDANGPLTEAGIFNHPELNKGVMYNRVKFDVVNKTEEFKLTLVWEILF